MSLSAEDIAQNLKIAELFQYYRFLLTKYTHITVHVISMKNRTMYVTDTELVIVHQDSEESNKVRFQVELEFVQCLANPRYLNFLAQRGYFKETNFINYLKYLMYWREPQYAKYLKYPQSLHMLELLQYEHFRAELSNAQCAKFIDEQQLLHWQHYTRKRLQLLNQQAAHASSKAANPETHSETDVKPNVAAVVEEQM